MEEMRKTIAYYESENMSTSTPSTYNDVRRKFREWRGEDPECEPGEKINRTVDPITSSPSTAAPAAQPAGGWALT